MQVGSLTGRLEGQRGPCPTHACRSDLRDLPDVFTPFKQRCEDRCTVRKPLPPPAAGALPLPAPASMRAHAERLAYQPSGVEDLNALLPAGQAKLATPTPDPRVSAARRCRIQETLAACVHPCFPTPLHRQTPNWMRGGSGIGK